MASSELPLEIFGRDTTAGRATAPLRRCNQHKAARQHIQPWYTIARELEDKGQREQRWRLSRRSASRRSAG
jgi:hypothetical protein